jgi:hypothetical protein
MRIASRLAVGLLFLCVVGLTAAAHSTSVSAPSAAIYVANFKGGYITVYLVGSKGDVRPVATIDGSATQLADPKVIALDSVGNIFVGNDHVANALAAGGGSVVVFSAGSGDNASPIATIAGPHTDLHGVQSIAVDSIDSIYVGAIEPGPTGVRIFAAGSIGDVKPRAIIGGHNTAIGDLGIENPTGVALDSKGQLLVANASGLVSGSGVLFFPPGSDGDVRPSAAINGAVTGIDWPASVALDQRGNIYVANAGRPGFPANIGVFSAGSSGNVPPIATISGSNTGLDGRTVRGIALDSNDNLYVTSDGHDSTESSITAFAAGSNGNVKPIAVISGDNTGLSAAVGIAIGPYPSTR